MLTSNRNDLVTLESLRLQENLSVKENKISTTQIAEELNSAFAPGKDFGFNTIVELESPEIETSSSTSDDL